jgi:N-acetylmuramoyl-L-alanine amidase
MIVVGIKTIFNQIIARKAKSFNRPQLIPYPILSRERINLTREYCQLHYRLDHYQLIKPRMVVVHFTGNSELEKSLRYFQPSQLPGNRKYIGEFGTLNVGVHFVVAPKGETYSLLPEDVIGRHTIGFNHLSLAIENVAARPSQLTTWQLHANARLISYLVKKHPSIQFLVGHHEYMNKSYPHYMLFQEFDKRYRPSIKLDPGGKFMRSLREQLKDQYQLDLEK